MSLDVFLRRVVQPEEGHPCRECDGTGLILPSGELYTNNVTGNLGKMMREAGVYDACWRPEEKGWTKASQIIPILRDGLARLRSDPGYFEQFNPENGWGSYRGLVDFVKDYLRACEENPEADIEVSR